MPKYSQDDKRISDGVNLLISILVRYPEIATIRFDPNHHIIKLTFMISNFLPEEEFHTLRQLMLDSMSAYQMLKGTGESKAEVEIAIYDGVSVITVFHDIDTLSKGKIAMCIALLREEYQDRLVTDNNDAMLEEDLLVQEELIDNMLENVNGTDLANSLIGIREDGRVLVFNK